MTIADCEQPMPAIRLHMTAEPAERGAGPAEQAGPEQARMAIDRVPFSSLTTRLRGHRYSHCALVDAAASPDATPSPCMYWPSW